MTIEDTPNLLNPQKGSPSGASIGSTSVFARPKDNPIAGCRLTINLNALMNNYRLLRARAPNATCAGVVKSNAYGLGIEPVAHALLSAGCRRFFVADIGEGVKLCNLLQTYNLDNNGVNNRCEVYCLSGVFDTQSASVAHEAGIIPVLNSLQQIDVWHSYCKARQSHASCAIHVDTGMNRLGLTLEETQQFALQNDLNHQISPILVMSHLACGDDLKSPMNNIQLKQFQKLSKLFQNVELSLANSAGIIHGSAFHFDVIRPGIALYGGQAINNHPNEMECVVTSQARIIQIRHVKCGETISYGASIRATKDMTIAIAAIGYNDGLPRSLSGSGVPLRAATARGGRGYINGHYVDLVGRVTMDLTAFDISCLAPSSIKINDWIELFGPHVDLEQQAISAGTIGYEFLTQLGSRYWRDYIFQDDTLTL